jgi:hypothetical protein
LPSTRREKEVCSANRLAAQVEQTGTAEGPATRDKPFYQRASFWLGPFAWGLGLLVAVVLGIGWYVLGGFPRDFDKYGEITIPGTAVLALPEGEVWLNFENHATQSGDSTTIDDRPPGLTVRVSPVGGGDALDVDDVPRWFSSTSGDRGHEPWEKVDVPEAGDYFVVASTEGVPLTPPAESAPSAAAEPPSVDSGPAISVGQSPWTPFDSRLLGAILCVVVVMLGVLLLTLPFRYFMRRE